MIALAKAEAIAARVVEQLTPYCSRIEIAGSIRRRRDQVGAIDLVLQVHDMPGLQSRVTQKCKLQKSGEQYLVALMPDGTQLDLWFAYSVDNRPQRSLFIRADEKPSNFGSLLLCRTGSTAHNMALCLRAKQLGMNWNPHWGVYSAGACIASATEEDIYKALKVPFIPVARREFADRDATLRLIHYQGES